MGKKRIGMAMNVRNTGALLTGMKRFYERSVTVPQNFGGPSVYFRIRGNAEGHITTRST